MAARTTAPRLSDNARRRLNTLRAQLLSHRETRVRLEVLSALEVGASDSEKLLRDPLFKALESQFPEEYNAAARVIWTIYGAQETEIAEAAIARLLPRRHALKTVLEQFTMRARFSRAQALPMGRALLSALERDVLLLGPRLSLAFAVLPADEFAALVEMEVDKGTLHAGALFALVSELQSSYLWGEALDELPTLHNRWQGAEAPELRRLALALLVNQARDSRGWTEESGADLFDLARSLVDLGVSTIIHTDIERDGMMMGPNLDLSAELAAHAGAEVIVSGGMRGMHDVLAVADAARQGRGIAGAIIGKAIYEGALNVAAAVKAVR